MTMTCTATGTTYETCDAAWSQFQIWQYDQFANAKVLKGVVWSTDPYAAAGEARERWGAGRYCVAVGGRVVVRYA